MRVITNAPGNIDFLCLIWRAGPAPVLVGRIVTARPRHTASHGMPQGSGELAHKLLTCEVNLAIAMHAVSGEARLTNFDMCLPRRQTYG